jgi:tripartite-type tricarboxylate transporter receptor subunit TctC
MTNRRSLFISAGLVSLAGQTALWPSTFAQTTPARPATPAIVWPTKPLHILVGFPPGSVQDLSARALAEPLAKILGQAVVVENKAGASGSIAGDMVAKATDDHTVGVMNNTTLTVIKMLNPATPFDPARDFQPIALIGTQPLLLVVNGSATGTTPKDWMQWLRNLGTAASYGSPGAGTPGHLGMELIKGKVGSECTHIPYPGNPQVINALLAGQLHAALLPPGLVMPHIRSGKLKGIAVTSAVRSTQAPEVPSFAELGIQRADLDLWTAMAAPSKMPRAIAAKLSAAVIEAIKTPEARVRLLNVGWQPTPSTAAGLASKIQTDTSQFGGIILIRKIKVE